MARIGRDEVLRLAELARLDLSQAEVDKVTPQLSRILEHVARLEELDTDQVEPTGATGAPDWMRADEPRPSLSMEQALANAGEKEDGYVIVPKILHGSH